MKRYAVHDEHRMPVLLDGETTIHVSSGVHYESGTTPTNLQSVLIGLVGPPEEIDRVMARFGIAPVDRADGQ